MIISYILLIEDLKQQTKNVHVHQKATTVKPHIYTSTGIDVKWFMWGDPKITGFIFLIGLLGFIPL